LHAYHIYFFIFLNTKKIIKYQKKKKITYFCGLKKENNLFLISIIHSNFNEIKHRILGNHMINVISFLSLTFLFHSLHHSTMANQSLHQTQPLKQIAIDYTPEACTHCPISNTITLTYDHRGGARWRSTTRFLYGTFTAKIQTPKGNTDGLNFNFYLSSLEGDKSQDEIDFEFLGKDSTVVQTNYYSNGNVPYS